MFLDSENKLVKINNSFINLIKLLQTLSRTLFSKAARFTKYSSRTITFVKPNMCLYITQLLYCYRRYVIFKIQILSMHIFNQTAAFPDISNQSFNTNQIVSQIQLSNTDVILSLSNTDKSSRKY